MKFRLFILRFLFFYKSPRWDRGAQQEIFDGGDVLDGDVALLEDFFVLLAEHFRVFDEAAIDFVVLQDRRLDWFRQIHLDNSPAAGLQDVGELRDFSRRCDDESAAGECAVLELPAVLMVDPLPPFVRRLEQTFVGLHPRRQRRQKLWVSELVSVLRHEHSGLLALADVVGMQNEVTAGERHQIFLRRRWLRLHHVRERFGTDFATEVHDSHRHFLL